MGENGQGADESSEYTDLKREVQEEIGSEEAILERLTRPRRGDNVGHLLTLVLMTGLVALVFIQNDTFFLCLIAALLIYSFNFVLILIPSTTERIRPGEREAVDNIEEERKWLALKLLAKDRRLAVDIGLTIFLCGIIPLSLSFSIIFGVTLALALYLSLTNFLADHELWAIFIRIGLILFFYLMVVLIEPQSKGAIEGVLPKKDRAGRTRIDGYSTLLIILMIFVGIVLATSLLGLGIVFLPGINLDELSKVGAALTGSAGFVLIFVIVSLMVTMRHFQGAASRRMVINIITARLERLKERVLEPLESLEAGADSETGLKEIKRAFYSMVIFDINEHDFFGRSQVYMVGPRLRYVLDDRVLAFLR